ncbi:titin [Caerostris darwini]|uniref:Titin n=1 Tax=Caerostris darwini TaxID=1538125 RepID=A0AAV4VAP3_9ARAC|nr:titin [Caerostris darwini]
MCCNIVSEHCNNTNGPNMPKSVFVVASILFIHIYVAYASSQDAPKIQRFQFPDKLKVNEKAGVTCMLRSGKPPYIFRWLKDNKELISQDNVAIQTGESFSTLLIDPITHTSAGNYTCLVKISAGVYSYSSTLTVIAAPSWKDEPFDVETVVGEMVSMKCSASGYPRPEIIWSKTGDANFFLRRDQSSLKNGTLLLSPVSAEDDGEYTCTASNGLSEALETTIAILVHETPVIQPFTLPDKIQIGKSLSLTCAVMSGKPPLTFKWYKNQKLLQTENVMSPNKKVSSLTIDPIIQSSGGNYSCTVSNSDGRDHFSVVLVVTAPPVWIKEPEDADVIENQNLDLKCTASGSPNPHIMWRKINPAHDDEFSSNQNLKTRNGSLLLEPVLKFHEGHYTCTVDNGAGQTLKKTVALTVRDFPKIQPFQFPQYIQIGYKTRITCTIIQGESPLNFVWHKNGRILKETKNINVESNEKLSTLSFDPVEDSSVGNYTCIVSNPYGKDNHTAFFSVRAPPSWLKEPEDSESIEGEQVSIHCVATGFPPPNIRIWKLDDAEMKYFQNTVNGSLSFKPVHKSHEGKYSCEADNGVGSSLRKTISLVVHDVPKIQPFQFASQIKRGDTASITCALMRGTQPVKLKWLKDGKPLENRQTVNIISNEGVSNLIIKSIDETSVGNYTCVASNSFGTDNFTVFLKVKVPPSWIKEPQDVETVEGHKAIFICLASGSPSPKVMWRKIGMLVLLRFLCMLNKLIYRKENTHLSRLYRDDGNGTLNFNPTSKEDEGSYECEVHNGIGESLTKVVLLVVHESPRIQPFQFPQNIQLGDKTSVICMIMRGQTTTVYEWYKGPRLLKKSENVNIDSNDMFSTLMIDPIEETSVGNYTCLAKNDFGQDSKSAFLFVKTPPFWLKEAENAEVIEGQSVNITCSAGGYPVPQITIRRKDETSENNIVTTISKSNQSTANVHLLLNPVLKSHSGKYICTANNGVGPSLEKVISILVSGAKDKIQPFIFPAKIREGESTKVMCSINAEDKSFTYKWLKNGSPLRNSHRIEISDLNDYSLLKIKSVSSQDSGNYTCIASNKQKVLNYTSALLVEGEQEFQVDVSARFLVSNGGTLTISNVQSEDGSTYMCRVRNGVGEELQKKVSLTVIDAPEILPFQHSAQHKIGDSATLLCSVTRGQTPLTFKWYKNGKLLKNYSKEANSNEKFSTLVLDPVTALSSGNYTCVVSNSHGQTSYSTILVVRSPPFWIKEPEDIETTEGSSANLICNAGGTPQPRIIWKKMGDVRNQDFLEHLNRPNNVNGTLSLHPVIKEHEGVYICEVNNDVGATLMKQANVVVHDAPEINPFHFPTMVEIHKKASVACILKQGQMPMEFKWLKDNSQLHESKNVKIKILEDASLITIEPVTSMDAGNYTCLVANSFGKDSYTAPLIVEAPSKWVIEPSDLEVMEGETASLICVADGQPPPRYTWKQIDGNSEAVLGDAKRGNLTFHRAAEADAGRYACEVENGVGEMLHKTVNLIVNGHPPKIQPFGVSDVLNEGESTKLGCMLRKGDGPFTFRWFKDTAQIKNDSQFHVSNMKEVSFLTVSKVTAFSSGNYTCEVRNAAGKDTYSASLVVKAPPKWVTEPNSVEGLVDSFLSVDCQVSGYPPPTITWTKQNEPNYFTIDGEVIDTTMIASKNGSLIFSKLVAEDEGEYVCKAQNNVGATLKKIITVTVLGLPDIQPFNFPPRLSEGASAKVLCNILHGKRPVVFQWLKDGNFLQETKHTEITKHDDFSMLNVNNIKSKDSGNYTCIAENSVGKSSHTAHLVVEAPPFWIKTPHDMTGVYGSRLDMECAAAGSPRPRITWHKGDDVIRDAGRVVARGNGSLSINILTEEDEAQYRCVAHNGVGEGLSKEIKIVVNVPARFDEKFTVVTVKKGDSASLRCEAIGDQPLSVIWKKESKELRKINGGRYEIFETLTPKGLKSELVLREADRTDGQLYTCFTENPYGKDERSIKLLVMEVPATPLDLKVQEVWSRSASVSWSSPYTGNSPITKYVLQYWRDAVSGGRHRLEEKIVSSAQTSALIKDLHPGINYGLAIVAENTVGRGEPSDTISFTTGEEEPSGSPMDVNVDVKGAASLLVTWKPPPKSEWNGKLKGYYVGYKIMQDSGHPYSFKTVDYVPGGVQEHMITSLRKDTEYSIIVKAYNSAGSGPPSQDVIVRTLGGDLPPPPIVFVVATSENSIKIQWRSTDTKSQLSGHAIHYRKKGESWQRVAVTSPHENSYTLTGLHGGAFYQLYVTANSDFGEGDPSDMVTVKTYAENNNVVLMAGAKEPPMMLDMSLLIPIAASLLAVTLVIVVVCIWVLKAKSRRNLERAIQEDKRFIYAAASQRYVDIDKTRSLPAYHDPALIHFPQPYATVLMGDDLCEDPNEMKSFLPQNMKDRPLPKPGTLKKQRDRDSHIYDSPQ